MQFTMQFKKIYRKSSKSERFPALIIKAVPSEVKEIVCILYLLLL